MYALEEFSLFLVFVLPLLIIVGQVNSQVRNFPTTFRVTEVLVATALIAIALTTLGPWGIIVVGIAFITWVSIACSSTRGGRWTCLLAGTWLTAITSLALLVIPPARAVAYRMNSAGHLKQIALAMHNYHETYGALPPPFLANERGEPQHSWRVLLLPYIEEQALYQQYRLDEPWNGPNNRQLLPLMPRIFAAPTANGRAAAAEYRSSYVVVVDREGAMPSDTARWFADFSRQESETTILAVESAGHHPLWLEPSDPGTDEAIRLYVENYPGSTGGHRIRGFVRDESAGWHAAMVDGSVRWIAWDTPADTWRALVKRTGDINLALAALDRRGSASPRVYRTRLLGLGSLAIICFLTYRSAWRRCVVRQRAAGSPSESGCSPI